MSIVGVVWLEICAFYFIFWFGDIDKLTAGVLNPNYLKQNKINVISRKYAQKLYVREINLNSAPMKCDRELWPGRNYPENMPTKIILMKQNSERLLNQRQV